MPQQRAGVHIEGTGGSSTVNAEWASVWGNAVATEKTAIITGLANLATARGAAYAVKVDAVTKGVTNVITSAGTVAGQVLRTSPLAIPAELAAAGVTKLVEAVVRRVDGTSQAVLAADTPTAKTATDCEGCAEP